MQNRKRITSLFVVLTLLISMFTTFAVSADTADEAVTTEETVIETLSQTQDVSVERTYAFGILSDADLSLDANGSISRAEFVALAVKMLNMENVDGSFRYNDVPDDYWAAKYINTACGLNLVSKADEFNPEANIQFSEAVKILVNAAGYEVAAQANGGYPGGYVTMAAREGILDNVLNKSGEITRLDAVKMIDNTLDVYMMDTNYAGEYATTNKTILSEYLKIKVVSGTITEVDKKEKEIKVNVNGVDKWYELSNNIDAALLVEDDADIYISSDFTGNRVLYIDFKGAITVSYDYIAEVNESASNAAYKTADVTEVYLQNADKTYKMDSDAIITLNDVDTENSSAVLVGAFAKFILRDEKIYKIEAYTLEEGGLIYHSDPDKIKFTRGELNDNVMEGFKDIDDLQIYIDGIPHTDMYDLKTDYLFDYYISPDEKKLIFVASTRFMTKTLNSTYSGGINLDGVSYEINPVYGLYVYSNTRMRYQKDGDLTNYLGKACKVFVDDNKCVRYIKLDAELESQNTFLGVVMAASTGDSPFDSNEARIKVFKVTGGQTEKTYQTDADKMAKSPIKMDYIREHAAKTDGSGFLKFTLNKENRITKVEQIDLWGSTKQFSGSFDQYASAFIDNLYVGVSTIFAAFNDADGEFKVKMVDFASQLRNTTFASGVTVISDYDPMYNPKADYVMLGEGAQSHRSKGTTSGFVTDIQELEDDIVNVKITNLWSTKSYKMSREVYNEKPLKKYDYVSYYEYYLREEPIQISSVIHMGDDPDTWATDTWKNENTTGFYKADKILYRDGSMLQFMVNGEPTDLMPVNDYFSVYEMTEGRDGVKIERKSGVNAAAYINSTDDVWFQLVSWGPSPRSVEKVIYKRNSIAGN